MSTERPRRIISEIRIQISEKCLYLQIFWRLKRGRAENHTCKYRHQKFCSVCLGPHEDVSLYGFLWLHCRKQRFYPTLSILWWFEVRELKVYNVWIVIYYSVFQWIGCAFLTAASLENLRFIFQSIFISNHIRKDVINCFVFSDKFLLLLPNAFWLLLQKWCTW